MNRARRVVVVTQEVVAFHVETNGNKLAGRLVDGERAVRFYVFTGRGYVFGIIARAPP